MTTRQEDTAPSGSARATVEAWAATVPAPLGIHACIDMAAIPDDREAGVMVEKLRAGDAVSILQDMRPQALRATPWLWPLHHRSDPARLRQTAWWAERAPCVTWITSPLDPPELARRLT